MNLPELSEALVVKFNGWVKKSKSGCWLWKNASPHTYGSFYWKRRVYRPQYISWLIHKGPVPDGLWLLHTCDARICVNPEHLMLGEAIDNMADMHSKGRHRGSEGAALTSILLRLQDEERAALTKAAKAEDRSINNYVRHILRQHLGLGESSDGVKLTDPQIVNKDVR